MGRAEVGRGDPKIRPARLSLPDRAGRAEFTGAGSVMGTTRLRAYRPWSRRLLEHRGGRAPRANRVWGSRRCSVAGHSRASDVWIANRKRTRSRAFRGGFPCPSRPSTAGVRWGGRLVECAGNIAEQESTRNEEANGKSAMPRRDFCGSPRVQRGRGAEYARVGQGEITAKQRQPLRERKIRSNVLASGQRIRGLRGGNTRAIREDCLRERGSAEHQSGPRRPTKGVLSAPSINAALPHGFGEVAARGAFRSALQRDDAVSTRSSPIQRVPCSRYRHSGGHAQGHSSGYARAMKRPHARRPSSGKLPRPRSRQNMSSSSATTRLRLTVGPVGPQGAFRGATGHAGTGGNQLA